MTLRDVGEIAFAHVGNALQAPARAFPAFAADYPAPKEGEPQLKAGEEFKPFAEVKADGQFQVVWKTEGPIRAMPWSPFVPDSKAKVADWQYPWVCGNCTEPKFKLPMAPVAEAAPGK